MGKPTKKQRADSTAKEPTQEQPTLAESWTLRSSARISVAGGVTQAVATRSCGHTQTLTLAEGSDIEFAFTVTVGQFSDGMVRFADDCRTCDVLSRAENAASGDTV